ncbi:hypothetical protein ACM01_04920 [Streptomyces viridochromogenes]|uniref:Uncharacterized protein n=1 Tax=Streptomyces viridochromogenes TaxID=1938 RepID=A0A0J7ZKW0_STRVR|nr:hypothetical protein [Streptomyces viridochromogenes]KMS76529.1 hypothetical protein ACM01_04920 [Streptomyces viridochromogenes]KOG23306.1 hypothetical protein ADK35_13575 [Streptomyces viridochromogenes]KOG27089.1 hypothetical protein ADK36_00495 [Streptomyces viridochromogenes]
MLIARTLAEARVYVSLAIAADQGVPAVEPPPMVLGSNLTEGADAWTYSSPAGDIAISYASEDACRTIGARFGLGVSRLVDAAQWAVVAATYARRALEADMAYTGGPDEDRSIVESNWEAAAEAVGEALKFLPDGAEVVPDEGVWSEFGRESRARNPALVTRAKLADDLEYYRGTLDDFRALYGW